jgi:hypothetical protein
MTEPTPVEAMIQKQEESLQRIAMRILELPKGQREVAFSHAKANFEQHGLPSTVTDAINRGKMTAVLMTRLRTLVTDMEAAGGQSSGL